MIERSIFFARIRARLFPRGLSRTQVQGLERLLDEWERRSHDDLRWLAYCLATACHETAFTFAPLRETGLGKGRPYGLRDAQTGCVYYGRGFVQLTWKRNYALMAARFGVDLVNDPDLALQPGLAAKILFDGMIEGLFTGVRLAHVFNDAECDWDGARRIVNGMDRADSIARLAQDFHAALRAATARPQENLAQRLLRLMRALLPF